ncbi:hypothetical protein BDD12DRAFT_803300 [Trichophaea hybrida]|nr:hypothetical protein BDD12DRAFT_803300 [Trichophaea hybrida]
MTGVYALPPPHQALRVSSHFHPLRPTFPLDAGSLNFAWHLPPTNLLKLSLRKLNLFGIQGERLRTIRILPARMQRRTRTPSVCLWVNLNGKLIKLKAVIRRPHSSFLPIRVIPYISWSKSAFSISIYLLQETLLRYIGSGACIATLSPGPSSKHYSKKTRKTGHRAVYNP